MRDGIDTFAGMDRLQAAIHRLTTGRAPDEILIPEGTPLEDMLWCFNDGRELRIIDCTREQLLRIVEVLTQVIGHRQYLEEQARAARGQA